MLRKVISGGQTGVDRAGLDAALDAGLPVGGYCPKGKKAEDGIISAKYPLEEMPSSSYSARTEKNVVCSDGTLIINRGPLSGGTKYTRENCLKHLKPFLIVQLDADKSIQPADVIRWILTALMGINAAVVGLLLAVFYTTVWTSGILSATDFIMALVAFGLLTLWKIPPLPFHAIPCRLFLNCACHHLHVVRRK